LSIIIPSSDQEHMTGEGAITVYASRLKTLRNSRGADAAEVRDQWMTLFRYRARCAVVDWKGGILSDELCARL
jgi:hypothetical protein